MWVTRLYQCRCTRIEMIDLTIYSLQTIDLGWLYKAHRRRWRNTVNALLAWGMMGWHKDAEQFPKSHSLLSMSNLLSKIEIYLAENEQRMQRILSTFQFKNKDLAYGIVWRNMNTLGICRTAQTEWLEPMSCSS